jgi:hypothetical protein
VTTRLILSYLVSCLLKTTGWQEDNLERRDELVRVLGINLDWRITLTLTLTLTLILTLILILHSTPYTLHPTLYTLIPTLTSNSNREP